MKCRQLELLRRMEKSLKSASPEECAKLTKELVKLKDDWLNK